MDESTAEAQSDDLKLRGFRKVFTLSLLDVAIISGDAHKSRILHRIGVPQRYQFHSYHICHARTGVADDRSMRAVMAAKHFCQPLYEEMRRDEQLLARAIAGRQDSMVTLLSDVGIVASPLRQVAIVAHFMFGIKPVESRKHCRLSLRLPCLELAVAAGINLRSLRVDPRCAVCNAISKCPSIFIRNGMCKSFVGALSDETRLPKWRTAQTVLEMAIRCGQLDVTRYLTRAHCEATSLTADDLTGPMFQGSIVGTHSNDVHEVTINRNAACAEAARLAYHFSRNRYQLLVVQMSGWWSRLERNTHTRAVVVKWPAMVNHIATFALAVPPLPEILQLPFPFGTRRAVKRAARRAGLAGPAVDTYIATSNMATVESDEQLRVEVIQNVIHDSSEPVASISEAEAMAASHALWETSVESLIASPSSDKPSSQAMGISESLRHSKEPENIFLGKLNRIPRELLKEFAEGASMRPCRDALLAQGLSWKLGSGAMIFVYPWQHSEAMAAVGDTRLHPDHVVFAESVEYLVAEVLERHNIWMKTRSPLDVGDISRNDMTSSSHDSGCKADVGSDERGSELNKREFDVPWAPLVVEERTFLCLVPPNPVQDSAVTASSTDVHNKHANPRRSPVHDM